MQELIYKITEKEFGEIPAAVEEIIDQGVINVVFRISLKERMCILRMQKSHDALKTYRMEEWCMNAALQLHIPTPRPLAVGIEEEYAYSFQEFIPGIRGTVMHDETKRIWRALGSYAKKYNTIPAEEYKIDLTWIDEQLFDDGFFVKHKLLTETQIADMRARVDEIKGWHYLPMLCHGNLGPENTIVHPDGDIYVIDWGTASGSRAPHGELADIFAWNTGKKNVDEFIAGYGIEPEELDLMMHDIQTLVLVRILTSLRWKIEKHPDDWPELEFVRSIEQALIAIPDFKAKILFKKNTE
ncbi:MAG: aminoglycoside phosphotransferase family protein [Candidatus Taylorbacteria bacterium]|nr:aminoglycoside phosphotransferase family protein [Candidatus Taylorbacteria bacterium]